MSTDTDTAALIEKLGKDLKPVTPLRPPFVRAASLSIFALVAVFAAIFAFTHGFRKDLADMLMHHAGYLLQTVSIFAAGVISALAACYLSVPDTKIRPRVYAMMGISTAVWLFLILSQMVMAMGTESDVGPENCLTDLSLLMVSPLAAVIFMVTRGAPVWRGWAGYSMVLAVGSFAALGMRFICPNDSPAHLLVWHFLPVLVFALVGIILGKILLKKNIAKI